MRSFRFFSLLLPLLFAYSAFSSDVLEADPPAISYDGLRLVASAKNNHVYVKPAADFADYDKIILLDCQVSFKKNWQRDYNREQRSTTRRVTEKDVARIKADVAQLFDEVFRGELATVKGYQVVTAPAENTLLVKPALVNLDVYAPDVMPPSRVRSYVEKAGEGTLNLEIYDAVSGAILARVVDRRETRDHGYFYWANRVSNRADARQLLKKWAKKMHEKLLEVKGR